MATFNKFNQFVEDLAEKVHNLQADTLKVMLSNTLPAATNSVKANIIEITAQNGYPAGGSQATVASSQQSGGTYKLTLNDVMFTAAGGSFGPFQYVVLYNDTPTSPADPLIGWYDYGATLTVTSGNSFTVDFDGSNGVLTIA
jgi:hypothetical protein